MNSKMTSELLLCNSITNGRNERSANVVVYVHVIFSAIELLSTVVTSSLYPLTMIRLHHNHILFYNIITNQSNSVLLGKHDTEYTIATVTNDNNGILSCQTKL